jgi:hypothetical protein
MTSEKSVSLDADNPRVQATLGKLMQVQWGLRLFYSIGFYVGAFINSTRIGFREGKGEF